MAAEELPRPLHNRWAKEDTGKNQRGAKVWDWDMHGVRDEGG